ncbi:MAG TPA: alpha/beta fold hydrolase [Nitrososphaeraceae archaeon]|nr:alpha/beta fold hydrolase [Nitrososphaeraceae archaeon]
MYRTKNRPPLGLLLISTLALSCLSTTIFNERNNEAMSQQYIQTIKHRDLVLDLGNGLKTNAQLTLPAIGSGPFPGVLLIPGSGALDMDETLAKNAKPFWQIAQYLSERGFAVLRYDKRGVGSTSNTILDTNVWGNTTANDLIQDNKKSLNVLIQQPEVDPKRISIIGHSEGTLYAPRVAIDNSTNVKNIILMGVLAQNPVKVVEYYQDVSLPLEYATQVLDRNHTGTISIQQIANDPFLRQLLMPPSVMLTFLHTNDTKVITTTLAKGFNTSGHISIEKQLKPVMVKAYENVTAFNLLKCKTLVICPILMRSLSSLIPNLSIIGNVSKSTGILLLNGENDTQTPVQQAFLLQQELTELNHPDHTLITYPILGHVFYPSSQWSTGIGPIQQYVLADLYAWLEAHSGLTDSYVTTSASTMGAIKSSLNTNKTS